MAQLSKTRTIFGFTSPRTIGKIVPEIELLSQSLSGVKWDKKSQITFFDSLFSSEFYQGSKYPQNPAFAARDRITRAPKALGFIDLNPVIALSPAGEKLISGVRISETFTRQLLKFQLPSPYHRLSEDKDFNVRPYLELLRLTDRLKYLSKIEIAAFFVQLTNYNKFSVISGMIQDYRLAYKNKGQVNGKVYNDSIFKKELRSVYSIEIRAADFKGREDSNNNEEDFINLKKRNHIDYADALMRYLRSTELVTYDKNFNLIIAESKRKEVDFLLNETNINREALQFEGKQGMSNFKKYIFNPQLPLLLTDDKDYLEQMFAERNFDFDRNLHVDVLKARLDQLEEVQLLTVISTVKESLREYREYEEIVNTFNMIIKKTMPDPALYLEWNVWRSFIMLNYAVSTVGNFRLDMIGQPLSTAGGRMPDIEVEYSDFKLIVEVTTSSGLKQYEMEGEPVARHYGRAREGSNKPVYCLFLAPKVGNATLAHFYTLNLKAAAYYGGQTNIVPMNISHFLKLIEVAKNCEFDNSDKLKFYLDSILTASRTLTDEVAWFQWIDNSLGTWLDQ